MYAITDKFRVVSDLHDTNLLSLVTTVLDSNKTVFIAPTDSIDLRSILIVNKQELLTFFYGIYSINRFRITYEAKPLGTFQLNPLKFSKH